MPIEILSNHLFKSEVTTKDNLLAALAYLSIQNGYSKAGIRDITKLCNIHSSNIYAYFSSKDEMVIILFKRELAYQKKLFSIIDHQDLSEKERLDSFVTNLKKLLRDRQTVFFIHLTANELLTVSTEFQILIQTYIRIWLKALEEFIKPFSSEPSILARKFFSSLHGAILFAKVFGSDKYLDDFCEELREVSSR